MDFCGIESVYEGCTKDVRRGGPAVPLTMVGQLASRCPSVLVNETTEAIDPDDLGCIRFAPHLRRPNWRPLAETLVWTSMVRDDPRPAHSPARGSEIELTDRR
jgi:hypothetical protein